MGHRKLLEQIFPQMLFLVSDNYVGKPTRVTDHLDAGSVERANTVASASEVPMLAHGASWLVNTWAARQVSVGRGGQQ